MNLFCSFVVLLAVSASLGAPMGSGEDDEYDDDAEFPIRKAEAMQKLKEEMEKQGVTSTTSSTTLRPQIHSLNPNQGLYNNVSKQKKRWVHARDFRGYQILSDGPRIVAEMVKTRPMLRIRVDAPGGIRDVERSINKRFLELKIRNWNAVHQIKIKVPFGYQPDELKVIELKDHIDVVAPVFTNADEFK